MLQYTVPISYLTLKINNSFDRLDSIFVAVDAELMPVKLPLFCFLQTLQFLPSISQDQDFLMENMSHWGGMR